MTSLCAGSESSAESSRKLGWRGCRFIVVILRSGPRSWYTRSSPTRSRSAPADHAPASGRVTGHGRRFGNGIGIGDRIPPVPAGALLAWFERSARSLPWRQEPRDPYAVLVSELMLQQTQVDRVAPRFETFSRRFPTLAALAAASRGGGAGGLVRASATTGGHGCCTGSRGRWRRGAARCPRDAAELARLPGVGPYTAAAVASLAFGQAGAGAGRQRAAGGGPGPGAGGGPALRRRPAGARGVGARSCTRAGSRGGSTRRSWSWAPRSAHRGHHAAGSARWRLAAGPSSWAPRGLPAPAPGPADRRPSLGGRLRGGARRAAGCSNG